MILAPVLFGVLLIFGLGFMLFFLFLSGVLTLSRDKPEDEEKKDLPIV